MAVSARTSVSALGMRTSCEMSRGRPFHQLPDGLFAFRGGVESAVAGQFFAAFAGAEADQLPGLQGSGLNAQGAELLADVEIQVVVRDRHQESPR